MASRTQEGGTQHISPIQTFQSQADGRVCVCVGGGGIWRNNFFFFVLEKWTFSNWAGPLVIARRTEWNPQCFCGFFGVVGYLPQAGGNGWGI